MQESIQKFGRALSGMVMPNIGAFIAWGIITALFISTGWYPNEKLALLVDPMVTYLLPLLIGYTGGRAVAGARGGVLGAIATSGVIVGAGIPMFIGAMIMGPLGGYIIKKFDESIDGKIPSGFEMLINNFSAGIIGAILALLAYIAIGPIVLLLNNFLRAGVETIVTAGILPVASIFIEPAKILFLNNAINHGVLGPIGIQEAQTTGKSIFFLLESNPGPGLGILLAYWMFAKGTAKDSAPGATIIHFLGGIHEIYFPYVLMNPLLVLAVIAGGMSGVAVFSLLGAGLVATPSPGSIFALLAMTPKGLHLAVLAGILTSTIVSFLVASAFVKRAAGRMDDSELSKAQETMRDLKGTPNTSVSKTAIAGNDLKKIIYACDAGMGSSAMGASTLRNKFKKAGFNVSVTNCAIEAIPADAQVVVTHEKLAERAVKASPQAEHIFVKDFLQNNVFEILSERLANVKTAPILEAETPKNQPDSSNMLKRENIKLNCPSTDKETAIREAGKLLFKSGYVEEDYIEAMIARENDITTYIGKGIAIPHGVSSAKEKIKKSGIVVLQYPDGVQFGDDTAYLVIGIAGLGNEHLNILANIATAIESDEDGGEDIVAKLRKTDKIEDIYHIFTM